MKISSLMKFLCYIPIIIILAGVFRRNTCRGSTNGHNFCLEKIASNLKHPTTLSIWPEGSKLLVSEHAGRMYLLPTENKRTDIHKNIFLDITDRILTSDLPADERGLLSFALHPEFIKNGHIYVCYSAVSADMDHKTVISRFKTLGDNLEKVDKDSEKVILEIKQPGRRQNGGQVFFGVDNYLYITTGDGGDLANKRFDKNSLLGKILRIDIQNVKNGASYSIPEDNPFVKEKNVKGEIYAYGFRNPWRCTVDQGDPLTGDGRGRIICGDNGEEEPNEEEIDLIVPGGRYGWIELNNSQCKILEECQTLASQGKIPPTDVLPLHTYSHKEGQAVVGGVVYRGKKIKSLYGTYVYADFVHGSLHSLNQTKRNHWSKRDMNLQIRNEDGVCVGVTQRFFILGLSVDHDGEIIVMTTKNLTNSSPSGALYRLVISESQHSTKGEDSNGIRDLQSTLLYLLTGAISLLINLTFQCM